ncbi:MAG: hypothetical protein ABLQ96_02170, partial [Candidatus Acidiferrum sp.]
QRQRTASPATLGVAGPRRGHKKDRRRRKVNRISSRARGDEITFGFKFGERALSFLAEISIVIS